MTVEDDTKMDILDDLAESLMFTNAIEVRLTLQGKQVDANKFAKAAKALSRQIDAAMGGLIDEWAEQSATINEDIQKLNENLKAIKDALKKHVQDTQQIVDAIGHVDDLTFIAKRLLKP